MLWVLYKLGTVIALLLIAVVLAIAFEPIVAWLERRRVPRWVGAMVSVLTVVACLVIFVALCGSSLATQGRQVSEQLVSVQKEVAERFPGPLARIVRGSTTTGA